MQFILCYMPLNIKYMKWFRIYFEKDLSYAGDKMGHYFIRATNEKLAENRTTEIGRELGKIESIEEVSYNLVCEWKYSGAYKLW